MYLISSAYVDYSMTIDTIICLEKEIRDMRLFGESFNLKSKHWMNCVIRCNMFQYWNHDYPWNNVWANKTFQKSRKRSTVMECIGIWFLKVYKVVFNVCVLNIFQVVSLPQFIFCYVLWCDCVLVLLDVQGEKSDNRISLWNHSYRLQVANWNIEMVPCWCTMKSSCKNLQVEAEDRSRRKDLDAGITETFICNAGTAVKEL